MELLQCQAQQKSAMRQFISIAYIMLICLWGIVGCGMCFCLDLIQSSLEIHYKMQNKYFCQASANDEILRHEGVWDYPSWIFLCFRLSICHLAGNLRFKFPKRFGDLFQRSHFVFFSSANLKTLLPNHWCPFPLHSHGSVPSKQQSHILTNLPLSYLILSILP